VLLLSLTFFISRVNAINTDTSIKCVADLDLQSEMIIFEFLLITFEASIIFEVDGAVSKIGSSLKPNHLNLI